MLLHQQIFDCFGYSIVHIFITATAQDFDFISFRDSIFIKSPVAKLYNHPFRNITEIKCVDCLS